MAFSLNYLQRVDATVDLNKISNPLNGQSNGLGKTIWIYDASASGSNEAAATVEASGYFNAATGYLSNADLLYVPTNDPGYHLLAITSATGAATVTTSAIV